MQDTVQHDAMAERVIRSKAKPSENIKDEQTARIERIFIFAFATYNTLHSTWTGLNMDMDVIVMLVSFIGCLLHYYYDYYYLSVAPER